MEYGILSLVPVLVAITLAIATKKVLISLFAGIATSQLILENYSPFSTILSSTELLTGIFAEAWAVYTVLFSILIGSLVLLLQKSGATQSFIQVVSVQKSYINSGKKALLLAYILGFVLFIESYTKILISGMLTRPIADKYRVSREKQAYVIDSVASSLCALIPFNSWGATLVGLISVQLAILNTSAQPMQILLSSIPFQVYSLITAAATLFYIMWGKDWGIMGKAENRTKELTQYKQDPGTSADLGHNNLQDGKHSIWNMLLPIICLLSLLPLCLLYTGSGNIMQAAGSQSVFMAIVGTLLFTALLYGLKGLLNLSQLLKYTALGAKNMFSVGVLIWFALAIGKSIGDIGTGNYIAQAFESNFSPSLALGFIYLIASIISFSTGTSWGTFAIVIPIAFPLCQSVDIGLPMALGAVISGSIMGDHCSPISDSTILSSMATGTKHLDHVKSQLPYVLVNAGLSLAVFLLVGWWIS